MNYISRRSFIKGCLISGLVSALPVWTRVWGAGKLNHTPTEIEGPFYPLTPQKDKDFDLTRIEGRGGVAKGSIIFVEGMVQDREGNAIEDATVDLWQANAAGRYRHPRDPNRVPLDPNFQGWAIVPSGKNGRFKFKTIFPGAYQASRTWLRPPHIHFKVSKKGYVNLTTQMYFPGEKLNETDLLLIRKNDEEKRLMIASIIDEEPLTYGYNITLQKG